MFDPLKVGNNEPVPLATVKEVAELVIPDAKVVAALFVNKIVISYPKVTVLSAAPFTSLGLLNLLGMIIYNIEAVTLHITSIKGPIKEFPASGRETGTDISSRTPFT
jgi:hypothetical protein